MKFIVVIKSPKIPLLTITLKIMPDIVIIKTFTFLKQYKIISVLDSITDPTFYFVFTIFLFLNPCNFINL
jgi:hypothetical protein